MGGRAGSAGLSSGVSTVVSGWARAGGGQGQAARAGGGRWVASNALSQASCHGQASGRCQVVSRPLRAGRPATWMSSARMVAPRATACRAEARAPSARVSACALTASWTQAALALNAAEGRCAYGPSITSAKTCSTTAWARWSDSACAIWKGLSVNTA